MATRPSVAIRLGTTGKAEVKQDFAEIAQAGGEQAARLRAKWESETAQIGRLTERAAQTAQRLAAVSTQTPTQARVNQSVGTGFGDPRGTAQASAAAFLEADRAAADYQRRAIALMASIDPLFAAQQRFNAEIAEAKTLLAAGALGLDGYAMAERRAKE